jgi:aminopeptidase N
MIKKIIVLASMLFLTVWIQAADNGKQHGKQHDNQHVNQYVHHHLKVNVKPTESFIQVTDTIRLPENLLRGKEKIHFLLHGNLTIYQNTGDDNIEIKSEPGELKAEFFGINTAEFQINKKLPITHYTLKFLDEPKAGAGDRMVTLTYKGTINHPIEKIGAEYARGFSQTPGTIEQRGAYLSGSSFWVPWFNDELVTFKIDAQLPGDWDMVSQGKRTLHQEKNDYRLTTWNSPEPMDEVYFIAARFKEYSIKVNKVDVMAFLRSPDDALANKYLETTGQYLEMYEKLIGPYPYSKFALIENFWETGYGMPSFTLLGPKVIRFPFILHSSYPHELLHNWWGNSVFVDYDAGNWCEGITAYMADHLIKEQRGQGEEYRKTTLQGYTHYAAGKEKEFPLTKFKARYDALSSSIGYGKSLMLFHMLRQQVGDKVFIKIIQDFNKKNQYERASYDDIQTSVATVTKTDFSHFFQQWVTRTGIPEIRITDVKKEKTENGYRLRLTLGQIQEKEAYALRVPAAFTLENQADVEMKYLEMTKKSQTWEFLFKRQPLRIDVDPQFDIARKLHNNEIPATLSNAYGADAVLILLPSKAPEDFLAGYRTFAEKWAKESEGKIEIKMDSDVPSLPTDRAIWLLGWENMYKKEILNGINGFPAAMDDESATITGTRLPVKNRSIIAAVKNSKNQSQVVVLATTDRVAALPGLSRKLPHYGKYSFLAFEGDEPTNVFKGQWPAVNSPMTVLLASPNKKTPEMAKLERRQPLGRLAPLFSARRMMKHVKYLASEELEGRGLGSKGIEKAAHYIAAAFKNSGLKPGGDEGSFYQTWNTNAPVPHRNVIGILPGKNPAHKEQAVILCAHYDHLGLGGDAAYKGNKGKIHFGADDNASGVAVMLELAHVLGKSFKPDHTIIFIAFTGEESRLLGSSHYVKERTKDELKNIMAVVNLDTVGRLSETGKLLVIGGSSAREWRFIFMGVGYTTGVETQLIQQELDASDQVSFIKKGIPGIQLFTGPHKDYHRPTDTVDKINPAGLVKVATVARETIVYLSERKEPMTVTIKGVSSHPAGKKPTAPAMGRRVRTGIMPDFAFTGKGMKIGMVSPDSPAAKAGLKKGDIIIKLGGTGIENLKDYSNKLKSYKPGDTVAVIYLRNSKENSTDVTLTAR